MPLTGAQKEELAKALLDAYDPQTLAQMLQFRVKDATGAEVVLARYVASADNFSIAVFKIIEASEKEGWPDALIVGAYHYRPGNEKLRKFCERHAPRVLTNAMQDSVAVLRHQLAAHQSIRDHFIRYQMQFRAERDRIEKLARYKTLHDGLHNLQVRHVQQLIRLMDRFPEGDSAVELENSEFDLEEIAASIRPMVERMPAEKKWFDRLDKTIVLLRQARETAGPGPLREAVTLLRRIVSVEPSRIYSLLTHSFGELRFLDLITAMEQICFEAARLEMDTEAVQRFRVGVETMSGLRLGVEELVAEHGQWQQIDNDLCELNARPEEAPDKLPSLWPELRVLLIDLSCKSSEQWAKDLQKKIKNLDTAIEKLDAAQERIAGRDNPSGSRPGTTAPGSVGLLEPQTESRELDQIRGELIENLWFTWRQAGTRFYSVDKQLDRRCTQLRWVGNELLEALLEMIPQPAGAGGG